MRGRSLRILQVLCSEAASCPAKQRGNARGRLFILTLRRVVWSLLVRTRIGARIQRAFLTLELYLFVHYNRIETLAPSAARDDFVRLAGVMRRLQYL